MFLSLLLDMREVVRVYVNTSMLFSFVFMGILGLVQMAADSMTLIGIGCGKTTVSDE
jgi:hypothetical protein